MVSKARKTPRLETHWEVWTYDVWGNRKDGYEVNDRYCQSRDVEIYCTINKWNVDTPHAFESAGPSDYQLQQVFSVRCKLDTDGDDMTIYVNRASDGYPIGELHCVSHASLSPIRAFGGNQP